MRVGVDFSQWGGALKPETVECWNSKGVEFAIVQYSDRMSQHLDALKAGGVADISAYVYLYWGLSPWRQTPADRTNAALDLAAGRINFLWLDAEDSSNPYNEAQLVECVDVCNRRGMPCGIYTGRWWWVPNTGNSRRFADLPLFHAEYLSNSGIADPGLAQQVNFGAFQSYGGWRRPTIWQYQGTSILCGHSVDMNAAEAVAPAPPDPPLPIGDAFMSDVLWLEPGDLAPGTPYRSYVCGWTPSGPVKVHVKSDAEHNLLRYLHRPNGGDPEDMPAAVTTKELKTYKSAPGTPEPDAK